MRIMIAGAGEIGWYVADQVATAGHDVTMIDPSKERIRQVNNSLDVQAVVGSAASATLLEQLSVGSVDMFLALSGSDEVNIVCASLARKLGARRSLARVDEVVYRKSQNLSYSEHFGIDEFISPETLAALELAAVIRSPGALAVEHLANGKIEMQRVYAGRGSKFLDTPLKDLALPEGVKIACIRRNGEVIIPAANDQIHPDDNVTLIGKTEQIVAARSGLESKKNTSVKVVIVGGGHTTMSLVRRLRSSMYKVTIIERDPDRCRQLAAQLPNMTILNGDGTNLSFLKEERIENADIFVSTTDSDETNIMSAMQARHLGASQVLVVIHRPDYGDLIEKMGINRAVSPRVQMAREILSMLDKATVRTLSVFDQGKAEILQLRVCNRKATNKTLRQISMPGETLILTIQRDKEIIMPQADTVLELNDEVIFINRTANHNDLAKIFVG